MNSEYVQNLRYKLQKRVRRLNSSGFRSFHSGLKMFWHFLGTHTMFRGITDDLLARVPSAPESAIAICERQESLVGETELEHAAISYSVLKWCVEKGNEESEFGIGHVYGILSDSKLDSYLEVFKEAFLEPFYEYLDEQLDDQRAVLALLCRYKHKCEWFARETLFKRWQEDTQWGERGLAQHLYEYLHDQGIDLHIEPQSASGEADLIAMQRTDDPLVADAKIFDPDRSKGKSYIASGFAQVYRYTLDYNEPFGYLVIYQTSERDLRFALKESALSTPFVVHNNKTIFLLTIDIFPHLESASKRGGLAPVEITEADLIKVTEEAIAAGQGAPPATTAAPQSAP